MPYCRCRFIAPIADSSAFGGHSLLQHNTKCGRPCNASKIHRPLVDIPCYNHHQFISVPPHLSSSLFVILSAAKDLSHYATLPPHASTSPMNLLHLYGAYLPQSAQ